MKRTILATTALVTCGSMATADVMAESDITLSGSAEIGVVGGSGDDAQIHRDARFKATLLRQTDTGLEFGTALELKNAGKYQDNGASGAIYIKGVFGTLTVGDTDGGFDAGMIEVPGGSSINDASTDHAGYDVGTGLDTGGEIVRFDYPIGPLSLALSTQAEREGHMEAHGIGVGWTGEFAGAALELGAGHQTSDMANVSGASAKVSLADGLTLGVAMWNKSVDGGDDSSHAGAGLSYALGDVTFTINGGQLKTDGADNQSGVGFSATYSLGTGATFQIGANSAKDGNDSSNLWSAGIALSF